MPSPDITGKLSTFGAPDGGGLVVFRPKLSSGQLDYHQVMWRISAEGRVAWTKNLEDVADVTTVTFGPDGDFFYSMQSTNPVDKEIRHMPADGSVDQTAPVTVPDSANGGLAIERLAAGQLAVLHGRVTPAGTVPELQLFDTRGTLVERRQIAARSNENAVYRDEECAFTQAVRRSNGRVLAVGNCYFPRADRHALVAAQWLRDGQPDLLFGTRGVMYFNDASPLAGLTEQSDGTVYALTNSAPGKPDVRYPFS